MSGLRRKAAKAASTYCRPCAGKHRSTPSTAASSESSSARTRLRNLVVLSRRGNQIVRCAAGEISSRLEIVAAGEKSKCRVTTPK